MKSSVDVLASLLLCGILGLVGQGIRAVVGLKNSQSQNSSTPDQQSEFNVAYLMFSLMIGFVAGIVGGLIVGIGDFSEVDPTNIKTLLGIVASGYAGADFIENSASIVIPNANAPRPPPPAPPPVVIQAPAPTAISLVVPSPQPAVTDGLLGAALKVVAPKVGISVWVPALSAGFSKYGLTSEKRVAAAIGQFLVEAGAGFQEVVENLNYTHAERIAEVFHREFPTPESAVPYVRKPEALANKVYANRNGNGDEQSGDGFRFRGRGLIQLTGRTEYTDFAKTLGKTPDEVSNYCETPEGAAMSGCWYLFARGCLPLADVWSLSEITKRVNGSAMEGNAQRIAYSNSTLKHLGGSSPGGADTIA